MAHFRLINYLSFSQLANRKVPLGKLTAFQDETTIEVSRQMNNYSCSDLIFCIN